MIIIRYDGPMHNGIDNFIEKEGIPFEINHSKEGIELVYNPEDKDNVFSINIPRGKKEESISWLEYKNERIPVFQTQMGIEGESSAFWTDTKNPAVTIDNNEIIFGFDIFLEFDSYLSGSLDRLWQEDPELKQTLGKIPLMNLLEGILFDSILQGCKSQNIPLIRKSLWPKGAPYAVCLTHDVDEIRKTYQYITWPIKALKAGNFKGLKGQARSLINKMKGKEPFFTFPQIMGLEDELGVLSSLYFLKERGKAEIFKPSTWKLSGRRYAFNEPHLVKAMKDLINRGWEVGIHGSYYSYKDESLLREEKEELESVIGENIVGTRQHHLNLEVPLTWQIHESIGLKYDTSLGFKDTGGFRFGTCFPFRPLVDKDFYELPTIIMDTCYFLKEKAYIEGEFNSFLNQARGSMGLLTLLWHHTVFDENEFPGWSGFYSFLINQAKNDNAFIGSGKDIWKWWVERNKGEFKYKIQDKDIVLYNNGNPIGIDVFSVGNIFEDGIMLNGEIELNFLSENLT